MKKIVKLGSLILAVMFCVMLFPVTAEAAGDLSSKVTLTDQKLEVYDWDDGIYVDYSSITGFERGAQYQITFKWQMDNGTALAADDFFDIPLTFTAPVCIRMDGGNTGVFTPRGSANPAGTLTVTEVNDWQYRTSYKIQAKFTDVAYFTSNPNNISGTIVFAFTYYAKNEANSITWTLGGGINPQQWSGPTEGPYPDVEQPYNLYPWKSGELDTDKNIGEWSFFLNPKGDPLNSAASPTIVVTDKMGPGQSLTYLRQGAALNTPVAPAVNGIFDKDGKTGAGASGNAYFKFYYVDIQAAYAVWNIKYHDNLDPEHYEYTAGKIHWPIHQLIHQLLIQLPYSGDKIIYNDVTVTAAQAASILTPAPQALVSSITYDNDVPGFVLTLNTAELSGKRLIGQYFFNADQKLNTYKNSIDTTTIDNPGLGNILNAGITGTAVGDYHTLSIVKTDDVTKQPMKNVEFTLTKQGVDEAVFKRTLITLADGVDAGSATTGSLGLITGNEIFVLHETTPTGYNALPSDIEFKINPATYAITMVSPAGAVSWLEIPTVANAAVINIKNTPTNNPNSPTDPEIPDTPTPTPSTSPSPSPSTSPSTSPSESPSPSPSVTPTDPTSTPPTGPRPPEPTNPGQTLVPNDDGSFTLFDDDGVPLGTWTLNDDGEWIFDEEIPMDGLPNTGDGNVEVIYFLLFGTVLAILSLGIWVVTQRKLIFSRQSGRK